MKRLLSTFAILPLITAATTFAAGGSGDGNFNFRPNSSGGIQGGGIQGANLRGGVFHGGSNAQPQPVSNQQQFFNQSANRQQAFFAQPVFPHSNFSQTQTFQPAFVPPSIGIQQTWVSPPVNSYLPPSFYSGYQPGFYVAPTNFTSAPLTSNMSNSYFAPPTRVFASPQPTTSYYHAPRPSWNSMGRW